MAVDSAELTVSGSGEAILDGTMTKTMQAYTVTASQDGNTVAKAIVCVYSPNHHTHKYDYSPDGSSVYNVFIHLDSVGEESGYCVVHDGEIVGRMSGSNTDEDIARAIKDGTIFDFRERTACP